MFKISVLSFSSVGEDAPFMVCLNGSDVSFKGAERQHQRGNQWIKQRQISENVVFTRDIFYWRARIGIL